MLASKFIINNNKIVESKNIKNNSENKYFNIYNIEKDIEIKSFYIDKNNEDITKNETLWSNSVFNKSFIKLIWDNKSGLFSFDFSFNENDITDIIFNINNEKSIIIKPNLKFVNSYYNQKINSFQLSESYNDINKIKTIQITLKNKNLSRVIGIALNSYKKYKQDYYITKDEELSLNFQNSLSIIGEKINKTFSSIRFSPWKIQQGIWNKKIIKIDYKENELFNSNNIKLISLEGLPNTKYSNSIFLANFHKNENNSIISIDQNTYYDIKRKETIMGVGPNSNVGYIPPFEFSGLFMPTVKLKINNLDFDITWEEKFDKPYFKNKEGIYQIYLEYSYVYDQTNDWLPISIDIINEAKIYNFTFKEFIDWIKKENI